MIDLHTSLEIHDFAFKGHIYSQTIRPHFNFGFPNFSCLLAYRSASTVKTDDKYVCTQKQRRIFPKTKKNMPNGLIPNSPLPKI